MLPGMDAETLGALLDDVAAGRVSAVDASARLSRLPYADLGHARIDHHRALRQGLPEAVYGPGKEVAHLVEIVGELLANGTGPVLVTRVSEEQGAALAVAWPGAVVVGRTWVWRAVAVGARTERVLVATAGTADVPVADECVATLVAYGFAPERLHDIGVAGLHRLLPHVDTIATADAVVVVAGMEGALASVVAGLTAAPVVAVPTSVGYGAALEGVTALLAMLSGCAPGISVVGIDNGYGAACAAVRALGGLRSAARRPTP